MKLYPGIFLLIVLMISSQNAFSQEISKEDHLGRKWMIDKVIINGEVAPVTQVLLETTIEFFKDHTFIKLPKEKNVKISTWKYNEANQFELYDDNRLIGTMKWFDKNHLIFLPTMTEDVNKKGLKAPEYHLKPQN